MQFDAFTYKQIFVKLVIEDTNYKIKHDVGTVINNLSTDVQRVIISESQME